MARAVHRQRYRRGVGYRVAEDGSITENYWEPVDDDDDEDDNHNNCETNKRKPYRIELIGVVCDAYLAPANSKERCGCRLVSEPSRIQLPGEDAAESLLVTALNEGRDVIMDGTLSWEPFVEQTIAMARAVHRQRYRRGVGYRVAEDGSITENYWEPVDDDDDEDDNHNNCETNKRKPYRIELIGVVCDAYLAPANSKERCGCRLVSEPSRIQLPGEGEQVK
ncbi:hypothetical protein COCNU_14G011910 [Cocos nucifera]|uniref:Uncharacterized protein n=1 Tax=Cocos nucifera TaxID=13894 RepID=A0A8K0IWE8_COCNU|nr:hypothetical protein COCNU_14G011910 [Cocos nucifera]